MNNKKAIGIITTIMPYISIGLFVLVWLSASAVNSELVPSPLMVYDRLVLLFSKPVMKLNLFGHIWASLQRVLLAMFFAIVVGVALGVMIGWNKKLRLTIGTLFEIIRPIPPIAWLPIVIMWFGIGEFPKVLIVFIGALMPIVINTYTGIKMVDSSILDMGRVFNASNRQLLFEIALPSAVPVIFAGIKTALGVGWMVVLAAEMIGAKAGVGFLITRGMEYYDVALIIVGMLSIGIIGALLSVVTDYVERLVVPWNQKLD